MRALLAMITASLATPESGLPAGFPGVLFFPAAMPATCVPCEQRLLDPLMQLAVVDDAAPEVTRTIPPRPRSTIRPPKW